MLRTYCISVLAVSMLAACGDVERRPTTIAFDSSGVAVLHHRMEAWEDAERWRVSASPLVEIGGSDSVDAYLLFRVNGVERLSNGDIVVANSSSQEIRVFDRTGMHRTTIGRRGAGPGEFDDLTTIKSLGGDSIAAYDRRLGRVSVFDSQGTLARTKQVPVGYVWHILDGCALVTTVTEWPDVRSGVFRETVNLFHIPATGVSVDTLGRFPGTEYFDRRGAQYIEYRPFGKHFETTASSSLVYVGVGDRFEILTYSRSGLLRRVIRNDAAPRSVTRAARNAMMSYEISKAVSQQRQSELRVLRQTDAAFPETMPAHGRMLLGSDGELWVQEYEVPGEEPLRWRVFDPDGIPLAIVSSPPAFSIMSIGEDWIAGVWKNEADVEYVRVHWLEMQ